MKECGHYDDDDDDDDDDDSDLDLTTGQTENPEGGYAADIEQEGAISATPRKVVEPAEIADTVEIPETGDRLPSFGRTDICQGDLRQVTYPASASRADILLPAQLSPM